MRCFIALDITAANKLQLAGFFTTGGQSSSGGNVGKGDIQVANPGVSTPAQIQMLYSLNESIDIQSIANSKSLDAVRQATQTVSEKCYTGSVSIVLVEDNELTTTPGDSLKFTFNNCDNGPGQSKLNGAWSIVVDEVNSAGVVVGVSWIYHPLTISDLDITTNEYVTVTFEGKFVSTNSVVNGVETTSLSTGTNGLYVAESTGDVIVMYLDLNIADDGTIETVNGSYALESTELGGRIDLTYNDVSGPINSPYPTGGNLVIVGLDATLTLIFSPTDVTLELDLGSNGTVDETSVVTWSTLEQIDTGF